MAMRPDSAAKIAGIIASTSAPGTRSNQVVNGIRYGRCGVSTGVTPPLCRVLLARESDELHAADVRSASAQTEATHVADLRASEPVFALMSNSSDRCVPSGSCETRSLKNRLRSRVSVGSPNESVASAPRRPTTTCRAFSMPTSRPISPVTF